MKIITLSDVSRLDRVFHNVVNALAQADLPELELYETKKFSITGGTIRNLEDLGGNNLISLVDEMEYDHDKQAFVPMSTITVYASKVVHAEGEKSRSEPSRIKPVRSWVLNPEATKQITYVIANFFLGHNHKLNRHFSTFDLREAIGMSIEETPATD